VISLLPFEHTRSVPVQPLGFGSPITDTGRCNVSSTAVRRGLILAAIAAIVAALPSVAAADTINVRPGKNALQRAINRAENGDKLRVHRGTYHGGVEIDKRLTVKAAGRRRPVITADCEDNVAIDVVHRRVKLNHLKVKGAGNYAIDVSLVGDGGAVKDTVVRDSCDGALYGINVYQSGHLDLIGNDGKGFTDAGIYVGSLSDIGDEPFRIRGNRMHDNNIGILVEFGADDLDVRVVNNVTNGNDLPGLSDPSGIMLRDNNDVLLSGNVANNNGDYGINLATYQVGTSDDNTLNGNSANGNGEFDLLNDGSGNCGSGNDFGIVSAPLDPC
jgi:parallel beta-helix repeat protein